MDLETLTAFFMWCSIINIGLLALATTITVAAPGLVHSVHGRFFPFTREQFAFFVYGFLGLLKVLVIVFNVTPWIALSLLR